MVPAALRTPWRLVHRRNGPKRSRDRRKPLELPDHLYRRSSCASSPISLRPVLSSHRRYLLCVRVFSCEPRSENLAGTGIDAWTGHRPSCVRISEIEKAPGVQLVILKSPLSIEECRARLRNNISRWPFSPRPMRGWMIGDYATLYLPNGRNSWRNNPYLRLEEEGRGTILQSRAYLSRVMIVFQMMVTGGAVLPAISYGWLVVIGACIISGAFWSVFIVAGLYISRHDPSRLREIVCQLLDAIPVTPLPPPPE